MFTNASGAPVGENDFTQTVGARGPVLLQDLFLIEKLAHFDREVTPERRMHANGAGAHGTFKVTNDITQYSKAAVFKPGTETPVFVRFSTASGNRGSPDNDRDVRGFAVKFYTQEGNWDLVGNNTPVFYHRDPLRFPDLNHVLHRDPMTNIRNLCAKMDFMSRVPESMHQLLIDYSDRGIPINYRHMHGFGSHTFSLINKDNVRVWCKFHLVCQQPIKNFTDEEAERIIGKDRDFATRDLFEAIAAGNFPKWELNIQVMTEEEAARHDTNPFDLTKVWSHKEKPLIPIGMLELNRNPKNFFLEVEQAAFSPSHFVPGISYSPDKMLQSRLFSYPDTIRYRLGTNFWQIPVNRPVCPFFQVYHRDGAMRVDANGTDWCTYSPNSHGLYKETPEAKVPAMAVAPAAMIDHYDQYKDDNDHYSQPRALFNLLSEDERVRVVRRFGFDLARALPEVQERMLDHLCKVDERYGAGVREAMKLYRVDSKDLITRIHQIGTAQDREDEIKKLQKECN